MNNQHITIDTLPVPLEEYYSNKSLHEIMQCIDHETSHITACERIDNMWFLTVVVV